MAGAEATTNVIRPAALTPDQQTVEADVRRRAVLAVGSHAYDAQDCAELLDMLGLTPGEGRPPKPKRRRRKPAATTTNRQENP